MHFSTAPEEYGVVGDQAIRPDYAKESRLSEATVHSHMLSFNETRSDEQVSCLVREVSINNAASEH